jgi:hypothetical protein
VLGGLWLGASAVRAAAGVDLERPDQLVDSGPYAFSRNPMYLAWTLGYVEVALVAGTAWPLLLLPAVLVRHRRWRRRRARRSKRVCGEVEVETWDAIRSRRNVRSYGQGAVAGAAAAGRSRGPVLRLADCARRPGRSPAHPDPAA